MKNEARSARKGVWRHKSMIFGVNKSIQRDLLLERYEGTLTTLPTLKKQQVNVTGPLINPEGDRWSSLENELEHWVENYRYSKQLNNVENLSFCDRRITNMIKLIEQRGYDPKSLPPVIRYYDYVNGFIEKQMLNWTRSARKGIKSGRNMPVLLLQ